MFLPLLVFILPTFHTILRLQRELGPDDTDWQSIYWRGGQRVSLPQVWCISRRDS